MYKVINYNCCILVKTHYNVTVFPKHLLVVKKEVLSNKMQPWDVNRDISELEKNTTICGSCYREINNKNLDVKFGNIYFDS